MRLAEERPLRRKGAGRAGQVAKGRKREMDQKIKSHWVNARTVTVCDRAACRRAFTINERRHHCRVCGRVYCDACSPKDLCLTYLLTDPDALGEDEEATAPDADELAESGGLPLQVCLRRLSRDHSELPGGVPFTRPRVTARVRRWRGSAGASSASGTSSGRIRQPRRGGR